MAAQDFYVMMASFEAHEVPEDFHSFVKNRFVHFLKTIFHRQTYQPEKLILILKLAHIILTENIDIWILVTALAEKYTYRYKKK